MQHVEIAVKNVKFHLSQDKINQFIVTIVSKTTNQQETTVAEADLAEAAEAEADMVVIEMEDAVPADMVEITVAEADMVETDLQEKCTKQHVEIAVTLSLIHISEPTRPY